MTTRMTYQTSKEEEIAYLRKFLATLDPDSHLGIIFEGIESMLVEEIRTDSAQNLLKTLDHFQRAANTFGKAASDARKREQHALENEADARKRLCAANTELATLQTACTEAECRLTQLKAAHDAERKALQLEVLTLKARVLDLMDAKK